jgi:hypothetical protein
MGRLGNRPPENSFFHHGCLLGGESLVGWNKKERLESEREHQQSYGQVHWP